MVNMEKSEVVYTSNGIYKILDENKFYFITSSLKEISIVHLEAMETLEIIEFIG